MKNVAKKILNKFALKDSSELKNLEQNIIEIILNDIKKDLVDLKIVHDNFISEKKISSLDNVNKLKNKLNRISLFWNSGKAQNISSEDWEQKEQLLFVLKFGDDSDRALMKPGGEITYFMSDLLYHTNKIKENWKFNQCLGC